LSRNGLFEAPPLRRVIALHQRSGFATSNKAGTAQRLLPILSRASPRPHVILRQQRSGFTTKASSAEQAKPEPIRIWVPIAGGLVITVVGGLKYFHDHFGGTEGLWRSFSFYSYAIPKYIQYRYHMWMDSPDHVWHELDRDTSKGALDKILELEGFYIKCGQLCASNIGDAFPPVWQDVSTLD
jgi:hypothetical protein